MEKVRILSKYYLPVTLADFGPHISPKTSQGSRNPDHGAKDEESKLRHISLSRVMLRMKD